MSGFLKMVRVLMGPPDSPTVFYRMDRPERAPSPYVAEVRRKLRGASQYPSQFAPAHPPFSHNLPQVPADEVAEQMRARLNAEPQPPLVRKALKRLRRATRRGRELQIAQAWSRLVATVGRAGVAS